MAREAVPFVTLKSLPKALPDGLEIIQVSKTLGSFDAEGNAVLVPELDKDGKPTGKNVPKKVETVCDFLVPKLSADGPGAYHKFRHASGDENPTFNAAAIRSEIVSGVSARLTAETATSSTLILPPPPSVRIVDKAEAAGEIVAKAVAESVRSGKAMSNADLIKMYQAALGQTTAA